MGTLLSQDRCQWTGHQHARQLSNAADQHPPPPRTQTHDTRRPRTAYNGGARPLGTGGSARPTTGTRNPGPAPCTRAARRRQPRDRQPIQKMGPPMRQNRGRTAALGGCLGDGRGAEGGSAMRGAGSERVYLIPTHLPTSPAHETSPPLPPPDVGRSTPTSGLS